MSSPSSSRMTPDERRASVWLSSIFALRMLGLFLILPVFSLHAKQMAGGEHLGMVGLAIGIYGLTQALLQIPYGWASDRYGRKRVIIAGLLVFAGGSFIAAASDSLMGVIVGRALQGAGAISAAVTALIADSTRDEVRTKAMAMVGGSIGLTFALSLAFGPWLYSVVGMWGLFGLTGALALAGIAVVLWLVPDAEPASREGRPGWRSVLVHPELLRLSAGVMLLHGVQMAMFVAVPVGLATHAGLPVQQHGWVYLAVVLGSFVLMLPLLIWGERRHRVRAVFLAAVAMMVVSEVVLAGTWGQPVMLVAMLGLYFVAFNLLEAMLPSLVSRVAPPAAKGLALGVYNTCQSVGLFLGGAVGGLVARQWGYEAVFVLCAALGLLWLAVAWPMRQPLSRRAPEAPPVPSSP